MALRRRFSRFMPDENQVMLKNANGLNTPCEVLNESYGGLGVVVDDPAGIVPDMNLEVELEGASFGAVVTSCRLQEDGGTFVGLKWLETEGSVPSFSESSADDPNETEAQSETDSDEKSQ